MHNRFIQCFRWWAWRRATKLKAQIHELDYFFWETTKKCNLLCRHCGSDCSRDQKSTELAQSKVLKVFEDIATHYNPHKIMVAVTGGEPLLRKDLFQILNEVKEMGFPWGMVTNGMVVTPDIVDQCIAAGMRSVVVSLDGMKTAHNWLRQHESSYDRAINALTLFSNAHAISIVEAITCAHPRNILDLDATYDSIRNTGANAWRLFTIFPRGRAQETRQLTLNREQLRYLFEFIRRKQREDSSFQVRFFEEGYLGYEYEGDIRSFGYCGAGINIGGLLCDGSFGACPSLSKEWNQGHVDELPFSVAWETRYKNMRNREWMKNDYCGDCAAWKNCKGSSLHLWNWKTHRPSSCMYRVLRGM